MQSLNTKEDIFKNFSEPFLDKLYLISLTLPQLKQWDSWVIKRQSVSSRRVCPQAKGMPLPLLRQYI